MHKHKARMTERRLEILKLIEKGLNNKQIAKKMGMTLCNTKLQKWRLYCYLCVHNAKDAVIVGIQKSLIFKNDLCESMKEVINVTNGSI